MFARIAGAFAQKQDPSEVDSQTRAEERPPTQGQFKVKSLHVYPIKSCSGVDIPKANVTATGFAFDRQWVVVRESDGKFVTQRQEPRLALVKVELPQAALEAGTGGELPPGLTLRITAPDQQQALEVPLDPPTEDAEFREINVWEWRGPAADCGDIAAAWFSAHLGKPVRLARYAGRPGAGDANSDPKRRPTDPEFAPAQETAYADGFPYLLIGEGSLAELNARLPQQLPMNRFRPNIVVAGTPPFAEDSWQSFTAAGIDFDSVKPCSRCKETTVDQQTAQVGKEPLEALHTFRSGVKLGWADAAGIKSWKHSVFFGQNLIARQSVGTVSVGDAIEVTSTRGTADGGALLWQKRSAGSAA